MVQVTEFDKIFVSALLLVLAAIVAYSGVIPGSNAHTVITNAFSILFPMLALAASLLLLRTVGGKERFVWGCFALGILLNLFGELSWAVYELLLGVEVPYPSFADVFWLAAYIPLAVGLLAEIKSIRSLSVRRVPHVLAVGAVSYVALYYFLGRDILASANISLAEKFLDLAYPAVDIAVMMLAIMVAITYFGGKIAQSWLFISMGFFFLTLADIMFSYLTWHELFAQSTGMDILWHIAYLLFAIGFYRQYLLFRET
ncbi:MAG: hypothetical protein ABH829_02480 [archaeon]